MKTKKLIFTLHTALFLIFTLLMSHAFVSAAESGAKISREEDHIAVSQTSFLRDEIIYAHASATYTFTTDKPEVLSLNNSNETITGLKPGTAVVTVKETYQGKTKTLGSIKYTVHTAQLAPDTCNLAVNETYKLGIGFKKKNATYKISSDNPSIASVDSKFNVTGKKAGTVYITLTETYQKTTKSISKLKVTVLDPKLNSKTETIARNSQISPISSHLDYKNNKATYQLVSSDKSILAVQANQTAIAKKLGTASLTIKETYQKKTRTVATLKVNVLKSTISTRVLPLTAYVDYPKSYEPTYYLKYSDSLAVYTLESKNADICAIDGDKVIPLKTGSTELIVTETYQNSSRIVGVLPIDVILYPETIKWKSSYITNDTTSDGSGFVTIMEGTNGNIKSLMELESTALQFTSSDPSIVSIDEKTGVFQTHALGSAKITITGKTYSRSIVIMIATKEQFPELCELSETYTSSIASLHTESITTDTLMDSYNQLVETYRVIGKEWPGGDWTDDGHLYAVTSKEHFWAIPNIYNMEQFRTKLLRESIQYVQTQNKNRQITKINYINEKTLELELNIPFAKTESLSQTLLDTEGFLYQDIQEFQLFQKDGVAPIDSGSTKDIFGSSKIRINLQRALPDGTYVIHIPGYDFYSYQYTFSKNGTKLTEVKN